MIKKNNCSFFLRLSVQVQWSGQASSEIITLNYVEVPGLKKGTGDITFVASIFSGALYSFGLSTSNNKNGKGPPVNCLMLTQQQQQPKKKEE